MVIYDLCCPSNHRFEGWFSNREEFETQLQQGLILCPLCGSGEITRRPSPPNVQVERRTARLDAEKQHERRMAASKKQPASSRGTQTTPQTGPADLGEKEAQPAPPVIPPDITALRAATEMIQTILEQHFENVGPHFSEEAIAIHLGDSEPRNLTGTATPEEEAELVDLGVPFDKIRLPRFDD